MVDQNNIQNLPPVRDADPEMRESPKLYQGVLPVAIVIYR